MKKRLAAAITTALVVGVASTTFAAANPFVDVPAKHWSYDAVTKLAQAGIVDGYGDGTFRGDKTITRYEMAQIVAKAMTKSDKADAAQKAAIDKLAVEYAAELNNLGVRVAKLESQVGTVKVSGDARIRYQKTENDANGSQFFQRLRINMTANVNENTSFYGRFVGLNTTEMGTYTGAAGDKTFVSDAALTTKNILNSGASVTVGRFSQYLGQTGTLADTTGMVDGIKFGFGNKVKTTVGYADFAGADSTLGDTAFAEAMYQASPATKINVTYLSERSGAGAANYDVLAAGFTGKVASNFAVTGEYFQNTAVAADPTGYLARVYYKGASAAKPDSFGFGVEYRSFEDGTMPTALTGANYSINNVKGWAVLGTYALAKNVTLDAFQTLNSKNKTTGADGNERTRVQINYAF